MRLYCYIFLCSSVFCFLVKCLFAVNMVSVNQTALIRNSITEDKKQLDYITYTGSTEEEEVQSTHVITDIKGTIPTITTDRSEVQQSLLPQEITEDDVTDNSITPSTRLPTESSETTITSEFLTTDNAYTTDYIRTSTSEGHSTSKPKDLEVYVTGVTSTTVTLHWNLPGSSYKDVTYTILIQSLGPAYQLPVYCHVNSIERKFTTCNTTITIEECAAYSIYELNIVAQKDTETLAKGGVSVCTSISEPEAPDDLKVIDNDNGTAAISWKLPCEVNGPPDNVSLTLFGYYTLNKSDVIHPKLYEIAIKNDYKYSTTVEVLKGITYSANLIIVLEDGTRGKLSNNVTFVIPEGFPGKPALNSIQTTGVSINASWGIPDERNGVILGYELKIKSESPRYSRVHGCVYDNQTVVITLPAEETTYSFENAFPYYEYKLLIRAGTSTGYGEATENETNTEEFVPENVQNVHVNITDSNQEEYNALSSIHFSEPCHANGKSKAYTMILRGRRLQYGNITVTDINISSPVTVNLKPEYNYTFWIVTSNGKFSNVTDPISFEAPPGVPFFGASISNIAVTAGTTTAGVTLKKSYFNESNGDIRYVALILSDVNTSNGHFAFWDGNKWPKAKGYGDATFYQTTDDWWNPFEETDEVYYTIGSGDNPNRSLQPDKRYYLIVRIFTTKFYRDSAPIHFITDVDGKIGMITGITLGLLLIAVLGFLWFLLWRKKRGSQLTFSTIPHLGGSIKRHSPPKSQNQDDNLPTAIPVQEFSEYCKDIDTDTRNLALQFNEITSKSIDIDNQHTFNFALLPENRRKNRYVNVLPFDATRVKLLIDEDDEIASDYINASIVKGYSGKTEYIATQGPLSTTCRDFWKMVLQENVTVIVMVSQFMENGKRKCYRYFPKKHESMVLGDGMEIKCTSELHFDTYCIRSLMVRKENVVATVTHMQLLEWPDFGVPQGTDEILELCYQLRRRINSEGGRIVVHCSAGVGRTGTLIATDILLQTADDGKCIDVYHTVLELRKQRTRMVQTEEQYVYIHKLVRDHLERPPTIGSIENSEPFYENISVIQENKEYTDGTEESKF